MTLLSSSLYLAIGAAGAALAGIWATPQTAPAAAPPLSADPNHAPHVPAKLVITHPRICAAVAVYDIADANDWGLRTTVANTALNSFRDGGAVPDCSARLTALMAKDFSWPRWQLALDAVDAVMTGDYSVSPDACARANTMIPLSIVPDSPPEAVPPAAARAQCVIYDLAFVEVRP